MKGINWKASEAFSKNPAWGSYYAVKASPAGGTTISNAAGAAPPAMQERQP